MDTIYDGFVSRHLNRRVSRLVSSLLNHTPVTPNQVSLLSLEVAFGAFLAFAYGYHISAALLVQASSIIDGVDGDLARIKKMTSAFGGFMDSVLDRYADAVIILGLAIWTASSGDQTYIWVTAFLALTGTFSVSYTRAKIEDVPRSVFDRGMSLDSLEGHPAPVGNGGSPGRRRIRHARDAGGPYQHRGVPEDTARQRLVGYAREPVRSHRVRRPGTASSSGRPHAMKIVDDCNCLG